MTYKIVITKTAQKEVLEAVKYISDELKSHQSALNLFNYAYEQFNSLSELPKRNAEINAFVIGISGIRYIIVKNYLAFYTVDDNSMTVKILRFLYNKRDWQHILKTSLGD